MAKTISFKKGNKADLPSNADLGEPLFCLDTGEIYVGMGKDQPLKPLLVTQLHLTSPKGRVYKLKVNDSGELSTEKLV